MFDLIFIGIQSVFTPISLLAITLGVIIGLIIGSLPGLTGNMAIALMVPITFAMEPTTGLVFLAAIYCSAIFGGSIAAILLGIPGTISSLATTLDGYPMSQNGESGKALGIATLSSVFGGLFSAVVLMFLAPQLAEQALKFGPSEYFALAILGLSCIASIGGESPVKGLISGAIGLIICTIGMEPQTGYPRFYFGNMHLIDGVSFIPALIGLFGIVSVLKTAEAVGKDDEKIGAIPDVGSVWIGFKMIKQLLPTWIRSSIIGTVIGIIPGAGTSIATFVSYDVAKKSSKTPEKFGEGISEGIAAPEAANNGVTGGSLIPLLSLGIPGNSTSALFLGALMIHGLRTGPVFFQERPDVIYGLFVSLFIANIIMVPIGLFLVRYMKSILSIPPAIMGGLILAFCATGVFSMSNNSFDILILIIFGLLGYVFYRFNMSTAPVIVAMVLGPMAETNLRQALTAFRGSYEFLYTKPITLVILLLAFVSFFLPIVREFLAKRKEA